MHVGAHAQVAMQGFLYAHGDTRTFKRLRANIQKGNPTVMLHNSGGVVTGIPLKFSTCISPRLVKVALPASASHYSSTRTMSFQHPVYTTDRGLASISVM